MTHALDQVASLGTLWDRETPFGRALGALDDAGDRWSAKLRGRRWADAGAEVVSNLSDYGVIWILAASWKGRRPGNARRRALVALGIAGVSSYVVNRAVKQAAGRGRPGSGAGQHDVVHDVLPVRAPASSSFPSGHTLASFCTAVVLPDRPTARAAALVFATAVAASRVHLGAHHTSDVLGGGAIGTVLGTLARPLVEVAAPLRRGSPPRRSGSME